MKFKRIITALTATLVAATAAVALTPGSASAAPPTNVYGWLIGNESGKCLTVHGSPPYNDGANIDIYTCVTPVQDNQMWSFTTTSDGGYVLISRTYQWTPAKGLTVRGAGIANGTPTELWQIIPGVPQANQRWYADASPYSNTYYLRGAEAAKCATVHGGGSANNTPVDIWVCRPSYPAQQPNQMWYFSP